MTMKIFVYLSLLLLSSAQSNNLVLNLSDDIHLEDISGRYNNVFITSDSKASIYDDFKLDGEIDLDNPPQKDGIYQITISSKGRFFHTGSYRNINFHGILVHRGAIVRLKNGVWSRYKKPRIRFDGNLTVKNVRFKNIHFLFDFVGRRSERTIKIINSDFDNISRVFSSDRISGNNHWSGKLVWKNSNEGFTFSNITISNSTFSNIKESILWGSPTYEKLIFDRNTVINSPNITTILNLLPYKNSLIHDSFAHITNNYIKNVNSHQEKFGTVSRPLFRVISNTLIYNNTIDNFNGIAFYLTGNNISVVENSLTGSGRKTEWHQNAVIMYKGISSDQRLPNNIIGNEITNVNNCFIHWSYPQDFRVINNKYSRINSSNTTNSVYSFEQGKALRKRLNMNLASYGNEYSAETFLRFVGGDEKQELTIDSDEQILVVKDIWKYKYNAHKVLINGKELKE